MIIEYEPNGRITHIVNDPVPVGIAEVMRRNGSTLLDLPPEPLPEVQKRDPDTGHLVFDEEGEPVMESPGMRFAECDILKDYVVDGAIQRRPSCGCTATVDGRVVTVSRLPEGSRLAIMLDPEDMSSVVETDAEGSFSFEVDEPGRVRICVTPPWPMLEEAHDVEIE